MPLKRRPAGETPPRTAARLAGRIGSAQTILKAIVGLLGLVPPIAMITGLIDIPASIARLAEIVSFAVSIVVVMAIINQGDTIRGWSVRRATVVFSLCALVGAAAATSYYLFADQHVFTHKGVSYVSPISPSQEMKEIVEPWGPYKDALQFSPLSDRLRELLGAERWSAVVLMIFLMVVAQLFLMTAVIGSVWKLVVDWSDDEEPAPAGES